jgi:hypothetical protein
VGTVKIQGFLPHTSDLNFSKQLSPFRHLNGIQMLCPFKKVSQVLRGYHKFMRRCNFETELLRCWQGNLTDGCIIISYLSLSLVYYSYHCFDMVHLHSFSVSSPTSVITNSPFLSRTWCCTTGYSASDILKAQFSFEMSGISHPIYVATYPRKTEASIILP